MDTMTGREVALRQAKAEKMAAVLIRQGATADEAAALPPAARLVTAKLAGTRPPSDRTWETVVDTIRAHWHFTTLDSAVCATCGRPFSPQEARAGFTTCEHCPPPEAPDTTAHDAECQECGEALTDYQPVKSNRYQEAVGGRCGRCIVSEYA